MCLFSTNGHNLLHLSAFALGGDSFLESWSRLQAQVRPVVVPIHP